MPMQISISNAIGGGGGTLSSGGGGTPFENLKSIDLDGVDDYVTMGLGNLAFNRTTPFSVSLWIKMHQSEISMFIGKGDNGGDYFGWVMWTGASGGKNNFNCRIRKNSADLVQFQGTTTHNLNQWHHVVMTYDGSGVNTGLKLYVNANNQAGSRTGTLSQNVNYFPDRPFNIGSRNDGNLPFNGLIDEVGIFDAELSASDVTDIYNSGTPASLASYSSLTNWWRCGDGDTAPTLTDNKGSINGTMTNFSTFSTDVPT
jgi:hypothetical protein